jgi:hypothetical protein
MEFLGKIPLSFYSPHLYNDEARAEKGIGWKFIFALTIIATIIFALELDGPSELFASARRLPGIIRTLPVMTIKDEKLSVDGTLPYEMNFSGPGQQSKPDFRVVIDTSYKVADIDAIGEKMQRDKIAILVAEDGVISTEDNNKLTIHDFGNMEDTIVQRADWEKLAETLENWSFPLITVCIALGVFAYNIIATFLSATIVIGIGSVLQVPLEYGAAMRLAAAAHLPAKLIYLFPVMHHFFMGWMLWAAYLIFAVAACRIKPPQQPVF